MGIDINSVKAAADKSQKLPQLFAIHYSEQYSDDWNKYRGSINSSYDWEKLNRVDIETGGQNYNITFGQMVHLAAPQLVRGTTIQVVINSLLKEWERLGVVEITNQRAIWKGWSFKVTGMKTKFRDVSPVTTIDPVDFLASRTTKKRTTKKVKAVRKAKKIPAPNSSRIDRLTLSVLRALRVTPRGPFYVDLKPQYLA